MKNYKFTNLEELHAERMALKLQYLQKERNLKADVQYKVDQFGPMKLINGLHKADDAFNISGAIMSFLLPVFVNKTLFRNSGFFMKSVATLLSSKLGKNLDLNHFERAIDYVKSLFQKKKKENIEFEDFGIPPDSETY